ncbi:MucB/RseB C-terminal domain-containing protein [Microbulbifer salipaludis]|uniref:MucB/RseB C-terminal domain-containing protein n=1 Tax=Microbulbifer salipaludis TaxID=187980 RepID=A0ABS3E7E8_9GAMM|nr:MucB/RseB C-terminal domain-containing protein [Microbulbifer salipaludis]MBN8431177.1 MucB/RseB C-terminal domain-containing protein [Microbulbifer salipaludis]
MAKVFRYSALKANSLLLAFLLAAVPLFPSASAQSAAQEQAPQSSAPVAGSNPDGAAQAADPGDGVPAGQDVPVPDVETEALLAKLADAVTNLEYRGLVTFEHVGVMETLEVVHGVRDGEQIERIRYLTGAPRELVSRGADAQCRRDGSPLSRTGLWSSAGLQNVQNIYRFLIRGEERIADREAVVLEARPRDPHRFAVVISVDKETGLPLKSMLVAPAGRVLERFQFVEVDLAPIKDSELQPQSDDARESDGSGKCDSLSSRWQLGWAPTGFRAVATRALSDGEMLVFSDGLNAFTVFVQRLAPEMNYTGRAVRGATVAYMDHLEVDGVRFTITVVGEIPDNTARLVARSVKARN